MVSTYVGVVSMDVKHCAHDIDGPCAAGGWVEIFHVVDSFCVRVQNGVGVKVGKHDLNDPVGVEVEARQPALRLNLCPDAFVRGPYLKMRQGKSFPGSEEAFKKVSAIRWGYTIRADT